MKFVSTKKYGVFLSVLLVSNFSGLICSSSFAGPIHEAIVKKDRALIEFYVSRDPLVVQEQDSNGRTPLMIANEQGDSDLAQYFTSQLNSLLAKRDATDLSSTLKELETVVGTTSDILGGLRRDCGSGENHSEGLDTSVLSAYKSYAKRLHKVVKAPPGFTIPSAFSATKVIDGRMHRVTYLPEIHVTEDQEMGVHALNVARELMKGTNTVFIEYASASDTVPSSGPEFFTKLVRERQIVDEVDERSLREGYSQSKDYPGIICSLPRATQSIPSHFVNLEPHRTPYLRDIYERMDELHALRSQKGGGPQKEIDEELSNLLEKESRYTMSAEGLRERDVNQATTLMEQAREGQSWAIGGAAHAQGVMEVLRKNGWTIHEHEK